MVIAGRRDLAARRRRRVICGAAVSCAALLGSASAWGLPDNWTGGNGSWSDGTNWSLGSPPGPADDATILTAVTVGFNTNSSLNNLTTAATLQLQSGTLSGSQAASASTLTNTGTLTLDGAVLNNLTVLPAAGTFSITNNGNNQLISDVIEQDVTVAANGYAQIFGANTVTSTVLLTGGINGLQLRDNNASLTLTSTGVIHGSASVLQVFGGATLVDNGRVEADQNGNTLTLSTSNITGTGVLKASNGGVLSIAGLLNGTGLNVQVDNTPGSLVQINGGGLSGTLASTTGTGLSFAANANNIITSATINGDLTFAGGAYAQVFGVNSDSATVHMAGTSNGIQLRDNNAVFGLTATGAIRGYGTVFQAFGGATLSNAGIISADSAGNTLRLATTNITGGGTFDARNGGTLSIGGTLTGTNAIVNVDATPGSAVLVDGGAISGSFAASTGSGISFANNGNDQIITASIGADLTFSGGAYAQVFGVNTESGTVNMAGTANGIQLRDNNASFSITSSGKMHGYGTVYEAFGGSTLNNDGLISADTNANTLRLATTNITGGGTFDARGGGILSIGGTLNGTSAIVHVDANPNSQVLVDGGAITGSFAASTGSGISFANNGNNKIITATIGADLTFTGGAYAQLFGASTESGTVHMSGTGNGIQLRDNNTLFSVGATGAVRGFGTIFQAFGGSTLNNDGTISADSNGNTLRLATTNITGGGIFDARNGGILSIIGRLTGNNAVVHVDANPTSAVLVNGGGLSGSFAASTGSGISFANNGNNFIDTATIAADLTFTGGAYAQVFGLNTVTGTIHMAGTANGIQLRDSNAQITIGAGGALGGFGQVFEAFGGSHLVNNGTVTANDPSNALSINNSFFTNSGGTVDVASHMIVNAFMNQTTGTTKVDGTLDLAHTLLISGGLLDGAGTIHGSVENAGGLVAPGDSPGILSVSGNYTQDAGGTFDVELAGATPGSGYDQLNVSGTASLAGTINVDLINGFAPFIGETFDVMLHNTASGGTFSSLTSDDFGLTYHVNYLSDRVQITIDTVPEPVGGAMILTTIVAGTTLRLRRKSKRMW
jgi:hypothetical protein